jgi:asparagine synthase (glutamine-hydrolysing)
MCGYLGSISNEVIDDVDFDKANSHNICRGPDETIIKNINEDEFSFSNSNYKNLQAFNRLAIVELSNLGSQPMFSKKYKTSILFNGEIFNHIELRAELEKEGLIFSSKNSDTEVLLLGLSKYGVNFIDKVIGQFSITFFDYSEDSVYLIRDRLGQKPLFYNLSQKSLNVSTNLKSLIHLDSDYEIDKNSIFEYLDIGVVSSPNTLFKNIFKVEPGEVIKFKISENITKEFTKKYWSLERFIDNKEFQKNDFFKILENSVKIRNIADVPVACFLSGGIDSSTIVKMLSDSKQNLNTFSVSHKDGKYDESYWFNQVVSKYQTNHTTSQISESITSKEILESIEIYDEPYSDPSSFPSYKIAKKISKKYKAAISGDGGDELLGGYTRINQIMNRKKALNALKFIYKIYPAFMGTGNFFLRNSSNTTEAYNSYFSDHKFLKILDVKHYKSSNYFIDVSSNLYKNLIISDYKLYLSEMMMLKVDRTSMANSLEVRSPFVDHRLIEYILSSDSSYVEKASSKKFFKEYLLEDFSNDFVNRTKMGFVFNLEDWIYKNKNEVLSSLRNGKISNFINTNKLNLLFLYKSRINANRLWKIYTLEKYLISLDS